MDKHGRFREGKSWHLSVNSAGQAELTVSPLHESTRQQFELSNKEMREFRQALIDNRFFEMPSVHGELVPSGSLTTITVAMADLTHTIQIRFLGNWALHDRDRVKESCGALRIAMMIFEWIDNDDAVDPRAVYQNLLQVCE